MWISEKTNTENFELDEVYWFINKKERSKTRENTYIMTMISREPRQIVGFDVQFDKGAFRLQGIIVVLKLCRRYLECLSMPIINIGNIN